MSCSSCTVLATVQCRREKTLHTIDIDLFYCTVSCIHIFLSFFFTELLLSLREERIVEELLLLLLSRFVVCAKGLGLLLFCRVTKCGRALSRRHPTVQQQQQHCIIIVSFCNPLLSLSVCVYVCFCYCIN